MRNIMEYHDRMNRFRMRSIGGTLTFLILTLFAAIFVFIKQDIIHSYYILLIITCISCGMFCIKILIDIRRPDFVITDQFIVFSNLAPIYLMHNKNIVQYKDIEKIIVHSEAFEVKSIKQKRSFIIWQNQLDDYSKVKEIILEYANRYKIMIHSIG